MKTTFYLILSLVLAIGLIIFAMQQHTPTINNQFTEKPDNKKPEVINSPTITKNNTEKPAELQPTTSTAKSNPIEAPIVEGIKARNANISLKDELYTDELVLEREKISSSDPIPVRPKQSFIKWEMQFSGSVAGAIAVKDNKLHFGTYDYQTFSLNAETGEVLSQNKTVSQPINTTRVYKELFLVPQRNGQVTAYSTIDGKEKWNHRSAVDKGHTEIDLSISSINVFGNRFYISKHWGNLYIANADTGVLEQDVGVTYESRINLPAIKLENGILFSNIAGELHCFKDDGTENWNYTIAKGYPLAMCLSGETLLILNTEKELFALNLKDRTVKWSKEIVGFGYDSITINNNLIYLQAKNIYAINPSDGKVLWQIKAKSEEGFCRGAPVISNGILFATEQNGRLLSVSLNDGVISKEFEFRETIRSPITIDNELLFIATTKKKIYAVDINAFK